MNKKCVICNKQFPASRKTKTCSNACRKLLNTRRVKKWRNNNPSMADLHRFKSSIDKLKKYHEFNDNDDKEVEWIPDGRHVCKECNTDFSYSQYNNMIPERIPYCPKCGLILIPDDYLKDRYQRKVSIGMPKLEAIRDECGNIDFDAEGKKVRNMVRKTKTLQQRTIEDKNF